MDNNQHKIAELLDDVVCPKVEPITNLQLGDTEINASHLHNMSIPELVRICSRNRPAGISETNSEKIVSSICLEYSKINDQRDLDREAQLKTATTPSTRCLSRSSVNAVVEVSLYEAS